jgi:C1A family cysteine protease
MSRNAHQLAEKHIFTGHKPHSYDERDYTFASPEVAKLLDEAGITPPAVGQSKKRVPENVRSNKAGTSVKPLPARVDLRKWCPEPVMQGNFDTCSVHVVAEMVEYFERRAFGTSASPSRRFLFRAAKHLSGTATGKTELQGVYIRQAIGALKVLGAPHEKYFPYPDITTPAAAEELKTDPSAFCYALAANHKAVTFYRLDPRDASGKLTIRPAQLLHFMKQHLAAKIPMSLEFPLYAEAVHESLKTGFIPNPAPKTKPVGSHSIVVVGYDDNKSGGALRILNSWGTTWGRKGFGWLPYDYVLKDRTSDLWTLLKYEWTQTGKFGFLT